MEVLPKPLLRDIGIRIDPFSVNVRTAENDQCRLGKSRLENVIQDAEGEDYRGDSYNLQVALELPP